VVASYYILQSEDTMDLTKEREILRQMKRHMDDMYKAFKKNTSAANYGELETAMLAVQKQSQKVDGYGRAGYHPG